MCVHPEDVVTGLQAALSMLYGSPYWEEATENPRHEDEVKSIMADLVNARVKVESLLAGIREDANERARAA